MISLSLLAAVNQPGSSQAALPPVPVLASTEFKQAIAQVEKNLSAGEFAQAETLLRALARKTIRIQWDEKGVPAAQATVLRQGRDEALQVWKTSLLAIQVEFVTQNPDIIISFAESLPILPETGERQGAVHFVNFSPSEEKVESVIGLKRGEPAIEAGRLEAASEFSFAIGSFLGLARMPREGGAMGRTDTRFRFPPRLLPDENMTAQQNLNLVEALKQRAKAKQALPKRSGPSAFIETKRLAIGEAIQGAPLPSNFQVTNRGEGVMNLQVVPDCSCFVLRHPNQVQPGETVIVRVDYRTKEFPGPINKALIVYTDDPEMQPLRIPVTGNVKPRFRFLMDMANTVILADSKPTEATVHLLYDEDHPWTIIRSETAGLQAEILAEEFSGVLADPMFDDPARRREGYLLRIKVPGGLKPGRYPMSLRIMTSDPEFPIVESFLTVQSGIVTLPGQAWFGTIENQPSRTWVELSRPGKAFNILDVKSRNSSITAKVANKTRDGYRIEVNYTGKGTIGTLAGTLLVTTDDPDQKTIEIGIAGTIK